MSDVAYFKQMAIYAQLSVYHEHKSVFKVNT